MATGNKQGHVPSAVFRVDCGGARGWGHLARGAALAGELQRRGWRCLLWSDGDPAPAPADLRRPFAEVRPVESTWAACPPPGVADADWVVVDTYAADDETIAALRRSLARRCMRAAPPGLLVLDDEGRRHLSAASVILNPRPGLASSPYAAQVPVLLGERHALVRSGLREPAPVASPFAEACTPVLVMLGGTDPRGLTVEILHALADVDAARLVPVVVRGQAAPGAACIQAALGRFPESVRVESIDAAHLAGWAGVCRYAVSAAGGTLYELALLRLPFVAITVAPNQAAFGAAVGGCWGLPVVDADGPDLRGRVAAAVQRLRHEHPPCAPSARPAIGDVDGRGVARVADYLSVGF